MSLVHRGSLSGFVFTETPFYADRTERKKGTGRCAVPDSEDPDLLVLQSGHIALKMCFVRCTIINDLDALVEKCKGTNFVIILSSPVLPKGSSPEQVYKIGQDWVEKYKDCRIMMQQDVAITDPNHDPSLYPYFADAVYECSRIAYQDVEGQD